MLRSQAGDLSIFTLLSFKSFMVELKLGVICMKNKAQAKPMQEILNRLR